MKAEELFQEALTYIDDFPEKAFTFAKGAAKKDFLPAYGLLSDIYYEGLGTRRSPKKALDAAIKWSEGGDANAHAQLAWLYQYGQGIKANKKKAFDHTLSAAELGLSAVFYNLSNMYKDGEGCRKNKNEAFLWLQKAYDYDSTLALQLAFAYEYGEGVKKDLPKAYELYLQAAQEGDRNAAEDLVTTLVEGRGCDKDIEEAFFWHCTYKDQTCFFDEEELQKAFASIKPQKLKTITTKSHALKLKLFPEAETAGDDRVQFQHQISPFLGKAIQNKFAELSFVMKKPFKPSTWEGFIKFDMIKNNSTCYATVWEAPQNYTQELLSKHLEAEAQKKEISFQSNQDYCESSFTSISTNVTLWHVLTGGYILQMTRRGPNNPPNEELLQALRTMANSLKIENFELNNEAIQLPKANFSITLPPGWQRQDLMDMAIFHAPGIGYRNRIAIDPPGRSKKEKISFRIDKTIYADFKKIKEADIFIADRNARMLIWQANCKLQKKTIKAASVIIPDGETRIKILYLSQESCFDDYFDDFLESLETARFNE